MHMSNARTLVRGALLKEVLTALRFPNAGPALQAA